MDMQTLLNHVFRSAFFFCHVLDIKTEAGGDQWSSMQLLAFSIFLLKHCGSIVREADQTQNCQNPTLTQLNSTQLKATWRNLGWG